MVGSVGSGAGWGGEAVRAVSVFAALQRKNNGKLPGSFHSFITSLLFAAVAVETAGEALIKVVVTAFVVLGGVGGKGGAGFVIGAPLL